MNLSFAGCGFLGIYHVGVAVCFRKYAPHLLLSKISGASAGAISACCMLCDLPLGEMTSDVLRVVGEARAGSLGPFSPSFNVQEVLLQGLVKFLPEDAHIRVSGKLHISLTRVYDGKNVIVSQFKTKEDLLQALLASCFIPVFSGMLPPRFHGIRYMDGGFSDNLPILDDNTITVSPFCGESDICPRDLSSQLFHVNVANTSIELSKQNIGRFARILFPPNPEILSKMCQHGFDDALRFLQRNNLISCTRCLSVQSTYQIQEAFNDSSLNYDPECDECKTHIQESMKANLPETVMSVFQNAIESTNKGFINKILHHRGMRLFSLITLPCTLPVDIMYATFTKIMANKPRMTLSLRSVMKTLVKQAQDILYAQSGHIYTSYRRGRSNSTHHNKHFVLEEQRNKRRRSHSIIKLGELESNNPLFRLKESMPLEDDTFEQVLRVTSQHEALIAFYYMDEHNQVKLTEIYDVTDSEIEGLQSPNEREINQQLEFDNDWGDDEIQFYDNELEVMSEVSMEESLHDKAIFSDPESEWNRPKSPLFITEFDEDSDRPESDQPHDKYTPRPDVNLHQLTY